MNQLDDRKVDRSLTPQFIQTATTRHLEQSGSNVSQTKGAWRKPCAIWSIVNDPRSANGGLPLDSTATRSTKVDPCVKTLRKAVLRATFLLFLLQHSLLQCGSSSRF